MAESLRKYAQRLHLEHVLEQWDEELNGGITPDSISRGSDKNYWWRCPHCRTSWKAQPGATMRRKNPIGCSPCSRKNANYKSVYDHVMANPRIAHLLVQWDTQANAGIGQDLRTTSHTSGVRINWLCEEDHNWTASLQSRYAGNGCRICAGNALEIGINDLQTVCESVVAKKYLLTEWDYKANGFGPTEITKNSKRSVAWQCSFLHKWKAPVYNRFKLGHGCPVCSGRIPEAGVSDLASLSLTDPEIAKALMQWDYEKNESLGIKLNSMSGRSNKKAWWKCPKGHSSFVVIASRMLGGGCSHCGSRTSKGEDSLASYIAEVVTDEVILRNERKLVKQFELDIYLPRRSLAFEYNGNYWHSDRKLQSGGWESAYEYHSKKLSAAEDSGIRLFFIWEDDWLNNTQSIKTAVRKAIELSYSNDPLLQTLSKG